MMCFCKLLPWFSNAVTAQVELACFLFGQTPSRVTATVTVLMSGHGTALGPVLLTCSLSLASAVPWSERCLQSWPGSSGAACRTCQRLKSIRTWLASSSKLHCGWHCMHQLLLQRRQACSNVDELHVRSSAYVPPSRCCHQHDAAATALQAAKMWCSKELQLMCLLYVSVHLQQSSQAAARRQQQQAT